VKEQSRMIAFNSFNILSKNMGDSAIISYVLALAALASAYFAYKTNKKMKMNMEQFTSHDLKRLFNEQNWNLYLHHKELPPILPSWRGLSDKAWAWRVLHLNHLNLLETAYKDHKLGLIGEEDLNDWKKRAKYWFSHLYSESDDADIREGSKMLKQVLQPEEGYSKEFRQWLRENRIIQQNLFSD
jgi:hypothetical protein